MHNYILAMNVLVYMHTCKMDFPQPHHFLKEYNEGTYAKHSSKAHDAVAFRMHYTNIRAGKTYLTTMQPPSGMPPTGTSIEARASTSAEAFM